MWSRGPVLCSTAPPLYTLLQTRDSLIKSKHEMTRHKEAPPILPSSHPPPRPRCRCASVRSHMCWSDDIVVLTFIAGVRPGYVISLWGRAATLYDLINPNYTHSRPHLEGGVASAGCSGYHEIGRSLKCIIRKCCCMTPVLGW